MLGDSADNPRFVETLPRRGYRFVAPAEHLDWPGDVSASPIERRRSWVLWLAVLLAAGFLAAAYGILRGGGQQVAPAPPVRRLLAVIPFRSLGGGSDREYIADGLSEEIISRLGRRHPTRLGVIASTSAMQYKNTAKTVARIGRELGVDHLLEGSVRHEAGRVRIAARLVRVGDQTHLWAETYERPAGEVLALHREVAGAITAAVEEALLPAAEPRHDPARRVDPAAYEAYLQGRFAWNQRTAESLEQALELFARATALDPTYALAHAGLADAYLVLYNYRLRTAREALPSARLAARRALELDGDLAAAYAALAGVRLELEWDLAGAGELYRRAIRLNGSYATARQWHAEYLSMLGRHEEAIAEIRRAAEVDPLSLVIRTMQGAIFYFARDYDQAAAALDRTLQLDAEFPLANILHACTSSALGRADEAVARLERLAADPARLGDQNLLTAYVYAAAGRRDRALEMLADRRREPRTPSAYHLALVRTALGDRQQALDQLERAYTDRDRWMLFLKVDPRLDPLRGEARFRDLLGRMSFPDLEGGRSTYDDL